MKELRQALGNPEDQEHLGRRLRNLRKRYEIPYVRRDKRGVYIFNGLRTDGGTSGPVISQKVGAEIIHLARGRCQMCGSTVEHDGIKLHVDHKIPDCLGRTDGR